MINEKILTRKYVFMLFPREARRAYRGYFYAIIVEARVMHGAPYSRGDKRVAPALRFPRRESSAQLYSRPRSTLADNVARLCSRATFTAGFHRFPIRDQTSVGARDRLTSPHRREG